MQALMWKDAGSRCTISALARSDSLNKEVRLLRLSRRRKAHRSLTDCRKLADGQ